MAEDRRRLDQLLTERGLARTRSRAADAVRRGQVSVDGIVATRPGQRVGAGAEVVVGAKADAHVSRAGLKLDHALDHFAIDPAASICLDLGASTGGFAEVLIRRGAARVYAVDVGHGQLDQGLKGDARIIALEGTDARGLSRALVPEPVDFVTADVSFISLEKVLPRALGLARTGARLVALVKPQFEVGPGHVGKDGVVRDGKAALTAVERVEDWLGRVGWTVTGRTPSPVAGKAGNREWLIAAQFTGLD